MDKNYKEYVIKNLYKMKMNQVISIEKIPIERRDLFMDITKEFIRSGKSYKDGFLIEFASDYSSFRKRDMA